MALAQGTNNGLPAPDCMSTGAVGLQAVNDLHSSVVDETSRSQKVAVTDNDVLLAIALHNNGAGNVSWDKVRSVQQVASHTMSASQTAKLDRDDVFSALALGIHDAVGSLEALACVSDITTAMTQTQTLTRNTSLDQNTVLLAIALHNSAGSGLNYDDVANFAESQRTQVSHDQDVTVPRDNTFLALALGAGGSGPNATPSG